MSKQNSANGRIWLGIILITAGALIFMRNFHFNILQFDIFSWPVILLLIGLIILFNHRDSFFGLILVVVGGAGIASRFLNISFSSVFREYWPVLLILLGVYTLVKSFSTNSNHGTESIVKYDYQMDIFSIFGESTKKIKSNNFLGGKTTSIFGELIVDLRDSSFSHGTRVLDSLTIFGATEIYLPNDWEVIIKTTTIFGGFDDQRRKQMTEESEKKILIIKGLVLFGGGEIKD